MFSFPSQLCGLINVLLVRSVCFPASSWFLLRQAREKLVRATVYFSIEHARVNRVPHDAFDVLSSICQIFAVSACTTQFKFLAKSADKRTIQTFVEIPSSVRGFLSLLNTTLQTMQQYETKGVSLGLYDPKLLCKSNCMIMRK